MSYLSLDLSVNIAAVKIKVRYYIRKEQKFLKGYCYV